MLDAQGCVFVECHFAQVDTLARDGRYETCIGGLLPGGYSIEVLATDGRSATGELRVLDLAADDTPLVLILH